MLVAKAQVPLLMDPLALEVPDKMEMPLQIRVVPVKALLPVPKDRMAQASAQAQMQFQVQVQVQPRELLLLPALQHALVTLSVLVDNALQSRTPLPVVSRLAVCSAYYVDKRQAANPVLLASTTSASRLQGQ